MRLQRRSTRLHFAGPSTLDNTPGPGKDGTWQSRTPAMAAGLADQVWSLTEWLTLPTVHQK